METLGREGSQGEAAGWILESNGCREAEPATGERWEVRQARAVELDDDQTEDPVTAELEASRAALPPLGGHPCSPSPARSGTPATVAGRRRR